MVMWTVLTWALVPLLAIRYGINGAALGYTIVGSTSAIAIYLARRYVKFSLKESVFKPLLSDFVIGVVLFILRRFLPLSFTSVWILLVVGALTYSLSSYLVIGSSLVADVRHSLKSIFTNK